jgi:tRNA modification GTPase
MINQETIIALATPNGLGAISVIRISGSNAIQLLKKFLNQKEIKNYQIKSRILST